MVAPSTTRCFTVHEFHRMAEAGIFTEDDRVELLDGEVVEMEPLSSRHAACVDPLNALFGRLGSDVVLRIQSPIRLDERSEPEPDVALLRPDPDYYADELHRELVRRRAHRGGAGRSRAAGSGIVVVSPAPP